MRSLGEGTDAQDRHQLHTDRRHAARGRGAHPGDDLCNGATDNAAGTAVALGIGQTAVSILTTGPCDAFLAPAA